MHRESAVTHSRDFAAVLAAAVLWGGGGVLGALLVEQSLMHPFSVAMWRMLVGGFGLLAWLVVTRRLSVRSYSRQAWTRIVVTGALTAIFEAFYFLAVSQASVGLVTLIAIGSAPIMTVVYTTMVRREFPGLRIVGALALALAGVVLLVSGSLELGPGAFAGALLALVPGAAFAAITVVNAGHIDGLSPAPQTALAFAGGGLLLVPVALIPGVAFPIGVTGWALTLVLGLAVTALAYVLYLTGMRSVTPSTATLVTLVEPLVAACLGWLILSERLGWGGIAGGVMLGIAVILVRPRRDAQR